MEANKARGFSHAAATQCYYILHTTYYILHTTIEINVNLNRFFAEVRYYILPKPFRSKCPTDLLRVERFYFSFLRCVHDAMILFCDVLYVLSGLRMTVIETSVS